MCNHFGFTEIFNLVLSPLHPGFTPKIEAKQMWFIGKIVEASECVYVNRGGTEAEKNKIVQTIMKRQVQIEDERMPFSPVCIFAEGTTTNGKFLMPFKRGAFQGMRAI